MKETFRENCKSFTIFENDYRTLLKKYKGKSGMKDEIRCLKTYII